MKRAGCFDIPLFFGATMKFTITPRISISFLVFIVLGVYYPAIFSPLNSVDDPGMYNYLLNTDNFNFKTIFFPGGGEYYRPLLIVSYLMDKFVWGLEESFMHLENILFHLCNTLLVFVIARRACQLKKLDSTWTPFLAALFFAIHPINTEPINWIAGRTDLLAGFFVFISMWLLMRGSVSWWVSFFAAGCLFLGCLAKETAIFFLPAALLLPFFMVDAGLNCRETLRNLITRNFPHFILFTLAGLVYFAFRTVGFSLKDNGVSRVLTHVVGNHSAGILTDLPNLLKAVGFYVKKLFIPFPLNFAIVHVSDFYILIGLLVCAVLVWLMIKRTLSGYFLVCAACVGFSALMIPLLKLTWTPFAERYLYISSAFFLVGASMYISTWKGKAHYRVFIAGLTVVLSVIAVFGTVSRTILWQDNLAFFQDTLKKSPGFMPLKNEIATALYAKGREQEATALIASIKLPENLVNYQLGLMTKAASLNRRGDSDGARALLRITMQNPGKFEPRIIEQLVKINESEVFGGKTPKGSFYAENIKLLTRLYQLTGDPFALYRLGQTHLFAGKREKAREVFAQVVAKAPEKVYYRQTAEKLVTKLSE